MSEGWATRLDALEEKAAFAEDTLDQLNAVIIRQQAQIDRLLRELDTLRRQVAAQGAAGAPSLRDELPPHY
ncbi:MAG: SlyX family protein [Burkholderiaceae bacterium]